MKYTESLEKARLIAAAAADKLATDITIIEVGRELGIVDYFVLATGSNERQVSAIADEIEGQLLRKSIKKKQIEKTEEKTWILMDYNDVVVHIMQPEAREFYDIEKLWQDCSTEKFEEKTNIIETN